MNKLMSEVKIDGKTYQQAVRDLYRTPEVQRTVRNLNGARADSELKMSNDLRSLGREYRDIAFELLKQQNNSVFLRYAAKQMIDVEGKKNNLSEVNRLQKQLDKLFEEARLRGVF
jgi:plasmid stability protein